MPSAQAAPSSLPAQQQPAYVAVGRRRRRGGEERGLLDRVLPAEATRPGIGGADSATKSGRLATLAGGDEDAF